MKRSQATKPAAPPTEMDILSRLLANGQGLSPTLARHLLSLNFDAKDEARMIDLAQRNQEGTLSAGEEEELKSFARAACLLGILHSKARKALQPSRKK